MDHGEDFMTLCMYLMPPCHTLKKVKRAYLIFYLNKKLLPDTLSGNREERLLRCPRAGPESEPSQPSSGEVDRAWAMGTAAGLLLPGADGPLPTWGDQVTLRMELQSFLIDAFLLQGGLETYGPPFLTRAHAPSALLQMFKSIRA